MATSGTVARTVITVESMIAQALSRAGKLPSTAGGELLDHIRETLYNLIADLGNDGINLWCMNKSVVNVVANTTSYQIAQGTLDITDMLYRTLWTVPGTPVPSADAVTLSIGQPEPIDNVTAKFAAAGTAYLAIEYFDFASGQWVALMELDPITVVEGAVFVIDLDNTASASDWRIRDTSGTLLALENVRFRKANQEITMAMLNKDDYINLPNKHYQGQRSLQFWYDKQIDPRVWVWPMSNREEDQIVIWSASQVEDPGQLSNSLAVPTRWYRNITAQLAYQTCFLIPPGELPPGRLAECKLEAAESRLRALDGESDGSSYQLAPRIGAYTK